MDHARSSIIDKSNDTIYIFVYIRGDMDREDDYYDKEPLKRTLQEIQEMAAMSSGENYCCMHQPLLNIPLDHIIPDELHLMLRVSDILIKNLIEDAMQWDDKEQVTGTMCPKGMHLKRLVSTICSCGVSFSVWEKPNADGKGSGTYDFTSLMGDDRKKLLKSLPEKLLSVIQPSTENDVADLWKVKNLSRTETFILFQT